VRIVNGMNQVNEWNAKAGQFHNDATGENTDTVEGIVLLVGKSQIWSLPFTEAEKLRGRGEEVPVFCRSSDGVRPDGDFQTPPAPLCRICPKAKPTKNADGSWKAPECSNGIKMLFLNWDEESQDFNARMLLLSKTATQPVKGFINAFGAKRRPTWSAWVKVSTKQEKGNGNTWFVPEFAIDFNQQLTPEQSTLIQEKIELFLPLLAKPEFVDTYADEAAHPSPAAGQAAPQASGAAYSGGPTLDTTASAVPATPAFDPAAATGGDIPGEDEVGF
jgi:hypothetical protein